MKKLYTLLLLCFCTQLASAINEVPNPGFESWTGGELAGWTGNNLAGVAYSITQSSTAHGGNFSAQGQAVLLPTGDTLDPTLGSGTSGNHFLITENYTTLEFYFQTHLSGGDVLIAAVGFYDGSNNLIATGDTFITAGTVGWKHASVILHYQAIANASQAQIVFYLALPGVTTRNHTLLTSLFLVDDVSLTGVVGIDEASTASKLNIYPIPAHDAFTVEAAATTGKNTTLVLTDLSGRVVRTKTLSSLSGTFFKEEMNVEGVRPGLYSLMILNDDKTRMRKLVIE